VPFIEGSSLPRGQIGRVGKPGQTARYE